MVIPLLQVHGCTSLPGSQYEEEGSVTLSYKRSLQPIIPAIIVVFQTVKYLLILLIEPLFKVSLVTLSILRSSLIMLNYPQLTTVKHPL